MKRNEELESVLTLMAALLGGPEPDSNGTHKHKCPKCGNIWEHEDVCREKFSGDPDARVAHTCKCGEVQWQRYHGNEAAELRMCRAAER